MGSPSLAVMQDSYVPARDRHGIAIIGCHARLLCPCYSWDMRLSSVLSPALLKYIASEEAVTVLNNLDSYDLHP